MGYTRHQILNRTASGVWQRVAPSVYDVAPASIDPRRALHAAVLATSGWASHRSAAELWGLIEAAPTKPDLLVPEGRLPEGIKASLHRTRELLPRDFTVVDGLACTSVNRTLLDLGRVVGSEIVESAVSQAIVAGRTSLDHLRRYLGASPLAGRRGAATLRSVLSQYDDQQMVESRLEVIVVRAVRDGKLPPPEYQYPLTLNGHQYRLDLAWPVERVFLEADGFGFHSERAQFLEDRERQNALVIAGWLPLRYTWNVARRSPTRMVSQVGKVLASRRP